MGRFVLACVQCGREHARFALACENGCSSLLRARYRETGFQPKPAEGLFRFGDWLPCSGTVATPAGPVLHRCERSGRRLGLDGLWASFNGYWPEIGARNPTGTFKDFEALPTLLTFAEQGKRRLILASAGNTARAFAHAAAETTGMTVLLVVPQGVLDRLWMPSSRPRDRVRILAVQGCSDYYEAIRVAEEISRLYGVDPEGGAKNVARRDGLGTVMLEAARVLGRLPDHYFQAVGSGAGAIGVFEAALRLRQDGRFAACAMPRLHLSQNAPFLPIHTAWSRRGTIDPEARWNGGAPIYAGVLANRNPPYAIRGGVRDVLEASAGETYAVTAAEAMAAAGEFAADEGIDLDPAAAVALASLRQAVAAGRVRREETILVNVTGGGAERLRRDFELRPLAPDLVVRRGELGALGSALEA